MPKSFKNLVGNVSATDRVAETTQEEESSAASEGHDKKKAVRTYVKLSGRIEMTIISNVRHLAMSHQLDDIDYLLQRRFKNIPDVGRLISDATVECFQSLSIPVPSFQGDDVNTHVARSTGPRLFRKKAQRSDWVWVKRREASDILRGSLNGRMPGMLNALFKLRTHTQGVHLLAHVSLMETVGGPRPSGPEGMVRVGFPTRNNNILVNIREVVGMAHLIALEPGERWLINNRIDFETWHDIYDETL